MVRTGLNKNQKPPAQDAAVKKAQEDLKAFNLEAPLPKKVEKIDVLKAYSESQAKDTINFVVVGWYSIHPELNYV